MAVIKSGATTDQLTVDPTSKAARVTLYDPSGNAMPTIPISFSAGAAVELLDSGGTNKASISSAGALKVDGSAATQPVSGTFWQGTQPVSIATMPTTPVTGTFWQATQPVSIAATINVDGTSESATGSGVPAQASYLGLNKSGTLVGALSDANGNLSVNISDVGGNAATAKGVQPAAAIPTQDLKDSGRTKVVLTLTKATGIAAEALVTLTIKKGDATVTTGTSYTVTAGKILRLQSMFASITASTAAINNVAIRLREGAASGGALALTSDIISELEASCPAAVIATSGQSWTSWPDGMELAGGQQIGVSMISALASGTVTVVIIGYEY